MAALYGSYTINVSGGTVTLASGTYVGMLFGTNFTLRCRMYVCTNTATAGTYRMGIINNSAPSTLTAAEIIQQDLSYGTTYNVVFRYVLSTGLATMWLSPANETVSALSISPSASASAVSLAGNPAVVDTTGVLATQQVGISGFGFHNAASLGTSGLQINIGSVVVGTTFEDVVPASAGSNPPFITIQPANTTNFVGKAATLSVVAAGDTDTITYQWYGPSGSIPGATSSSYTIPSIAAGDQGNYSVAITNAAGHAVSANAFLDVLPSDIAPTFAAGGQPTNTTVVVGSAATFTVSATDSGAPLAYQWFFGGSPLAGQTNTTFSIASTALTNSGTVKVTVTNPNGDTITSTNATLTVTPPTPIVATIQEVRSLLDNVNYNTNGSAALYTVTGTNTVWQNLTTSGNSEFFIQDGTAGITIFWSGAAASTNMPPAGAVVTVTAPLSEFDGLLEMAPVFGNSFHSVTWSTVGPLPAPQPLPFDPNIVGNPNIMQKHMVGSYFVASNVFLDLSTGPTFGNNSNDPLTNGFLANQNITYNLYNATNATKGTNYTVSATNMNGETFIIFYNSHTDIFGAVKPTGPVTIYGVLGIFTNATPNTNGYEFTPSRLADIVPALVFTNVVSNIIRYGDLATNTFSQNVLQPGETLTMTVIASDPGGGNVTLSALTGNGTWSAVTGNGTTTAKATYIYTGTVGAEGTSDTPSLSASFSSSGASAPYTWSIYVPTADEQNVRITEVLPFSSSDSSSPAYNPLQRSTGDGNANDQYIEIANLNASDTVPINHWTISSGGTEVQGFVNGESLTAGSSGVVFGGDTTNAPNLSTPSLAFLDAVNQGNGIALSATGGTVSLYDNLGNLVDRVAYPAIGSSVLSPATFNKTGQTPANYPLCSFSRFPTLNSPLVPQAFISTNYVTPGAQYNGTSWTTYPALPAGVTGIVPAVAGGTVHLSFTAQTVNATTLWLGNSLTKPFTVLTGGVFPSTAGSFTISNAPSPSQFYFITTQ